MRTVQDSRRSLGETKQALGNMADDPLGVAGSIASGVKDTVVSITNYI